MAEFIDTSIIKYGPMMANNKALQNFSKSKAIYHYTSIAGLQGILKNKSLWFTNIKYLNDKDEIMAGFNSMVKAGKLTTDEHQELKSILDKIKTQTFICCFSVDGDSLPLWNYYTKEVNSQGYNLEFDNKRLVKSILLNNPSLDGCYFSFGNVDYSNDDNSKYSDKLLNSMELSTEAIITNFILCITEESRKNHFDNDEELCSLEQKAMSIEKEIKKNSLPLYSYNNVTNNFEKGFSANHMYFVKRDFFKQEREFRLAITVPDELLPKLAEQEIYKFRINKGILTPYIELRFSEDAIKSITISPTVQSDLVELCIQDYLKFCKYDIHDLSTFIRHSKIPVRF